MVLAFSEAAVQMPGHTRPSSCLTSGILELSLWCSTKNSQKTNFGFSDPMWFHRLFQTWAVENCCSWLEIQFSKWCVSGEMVDLKINLSLLPPGGSPHQLLGSQNHQSECRNALQGRGGMRHKTSSVRTAAHCLDVFWSVRFSCFHHHVYKEGDGRHLCLPLVTKCLLVL